MNKEERRELGAHYTSEKNILKTIHGLFLDELVEEFESAKKKKSIKGLQDLLDRIRKIKILDPACGCGNFLILAYRELRRLEINLLKEIRKLKGLGLELSIQSLNSLDVDCLYGIEIEEFPAQIAKTAIWIMDHLMNVETGKEFGEYYVRLPLKKSPTIIFGNALILKWEDIIKHEDLTYILGNPPFIGHHMQSHQQKVEMSLIFVGIEGTGILDYVTAWYLKAANFIKNTKIKVAFVSTNSISQGEQVGILWNILRKFEIQIIFAHQTFKWRNEAKGVAAVHVVIIGFAAFEAKNRFIFHYSDLSSEPQKIQAKNINPYLIDGSNLIITNRSEPLSNVPKMIWGNKPTDGGNLIFNDTNERDEFLKIEPQVGEWVRPYMGGEDFIQNKHRFCLWLVNLEPAHLRIMNETKKRIEAVREFRLQSKAESTRKKAEIPSLFVQISQPETNYLAVPEVSSEKKKIYSYWVY